MEQVEVDGLRIAYQRTGAGPPLVLLHGYVGDGPTTWRHQLDGLCDQFTVVAWDAPGAGGSADPPESFGLAGYADCLAGFVQRLGLEQPQVWQSHSSLPRSPLAGVQQSRSPLSS